MLIATAQTDYELFVERDMEAPQLLSFTNGGVAALCRRCPDKTEPNDDSAIVVETASGGLVLAVADGVGGCPMGYKASAIAVQSIADHVASVTGDLRPAILDGIEAANREILDLGVGAATTLSVVEIQDSRARAYQVGDSMSLFLGQRGALKWRSTPQSPVGYAIESGMLDEEDGMYHEDRHVVSNLVGTREMHIEIGPSIALAPRDSVIVASDGLFDNLYLDEVIALGRSGKIEERVSRIAAETSSRMQMTDGDVPGKPDDLTVLLFAP